MLWKKEQNIWRKYLFFKMFVILQDEEEDLFEETPDSGKII